MNKYKQIVLLKGLEPISDYHFSILKSLLASELKLTQKMKEKYNKIQIADLMEVVFKNDAGVRKLIDLLKEIPELQKITEDLKKEIARVRRSESTLPKGKTAVKAKKQKEAAPTTQTSTPSNTVEETHNTQKRKNTNKENPARKKNKVCEEQAQPAHPVEADTSTAAGLCLPPVVPSSTLFGASVPEETPAQSQAGDKRNVLRKGPLIVMVLKTSDAFEYESSEGKNKMFHALVVTETGFFQVKVLDINLKNQFTNNKVIAISNYFECLGVLEIKEASSVSEAVTQMLQVPSRVIKRANETPKIDDIRRGGSGTSVYGLFTLKKKTVNKKNTIYEIEDNTGQISVIGSGKWHDLKCEEGDKLRLYCFQLRRIDKQPKLVCGNHSYIKVIKSTRSKKKPVNVDLNLEVKKQSLKYEPAEENGYQSGPKEVMVLQVTEPFIYMITESEHRMIHATVATENAFFRVKVFDMKLKDKFIPKNIIAISNYVGRNGFLEINKFSSVSNVSANRKMNIIPALIQQAKATPKISQLGSQSEGKYVNGIFLVCKKQVRSECVYYDIQDNTGTMKVVIYGRLTLIPCEEGDKLNLTCFQVASTMDGCELRSVLHSHLKVIKSRKNKTKPLNCDSNMETLLEC